MNATVNAARHPQGIRRAGRLAGSWNGWVRVGVYAIRIAGGNRNHKNNNHIIVFNNEKYHFLHNFWLLFVQAKKFSPISPHRPPYY